MGEEEAHYGQGAPPCPPHLTLHPAQDDNAKQATTTQKRHNTAEPLHSQILPCLDLPQPSAAWQV